MIITKEQFLSDLKKGWSKIRFERGSFCDEDYTCGCAIGAAALGSMHNGELTSVNVNAYMEKLGYTLTNRVIRLSDSCETKEEAILKLENMSWNS